MTCIYHKKPFQLGHSYLCKQWCEEDATKIWDTISFFAKLVDYQLMVIFLPLIPKDLPFVSIEYTVVDMFSMLQLLQNNDSLDIFSVSLLVVNFM